MWLQSSVLGCRLVAHISCNDFKLFKYLKMKVRKVVLILQVIEENSKRTILWFVRKSQRVLWVQAAWAESSRQGTGARAPQTGNVQDPAGQTSTWLRQESESWFHAKGHSPDRKHDGWVNDIQDTFWISGIRILLASHNYCICSGRERCSARKIVAKSFIQYWGGHLKECVLWFWSPSSWK